MPVRKNPVLSIESRNLGQKVHFISPECIYVLTRSMISILHVDPDPVIRERLSAFFRERPGLVVDGLPSAISALDILKTKKYDAIISEFVIPVTDGETFLEILRRSRKDPTPFIFFFSKKVRTDAIIRALNTGATFYVSKGDSPEDEFPLLSHYIHQAVQLKRTEAALVESERRYRSVVEDQTEFIIRFFPDGSLTFMNDAYRRYFHVTGDYAVENIFPFIPVGHRDRFFDELRALSPGNPTSTGDSRFVDPGGKVSWQRWNNRAVFDSTGRVVEYPCVGRDITDQKNAELSLIQVNRNLGIMNTITRHDVLNQLTVVFGFLELSIEGASDPGVKEHVRKAFAAAETIQAQILFTRDYQEIGSHAPQWQNLDSVIRKTMKTLDLSGIEVTLEAGDLWVFADILIEKVFYNLFENSLRHGGNITRIRISCTGNGSEAVVVYEDDGTGIPAGAKEKIFRREYFRNTGLGLYLIREILAMTQISIRETGMEGEGVRFEIHIPEGRYGKRVE